MTDKNKATRYMLLPFFSFLKITKMSKKVKAGVIMLLCMGAIGICEPVINNIRLGGQRPNAIGVFPPSASPSWQAPFGSDAYGRDIFGMTIMGIRFTLTIGLIAAFMGLPIAITLGFLAGYMRGLIDNILRSIMDFMMVMPIWPLLVLISAYLPQLDVIGLSFIIAIFDWAPLARILRSQVLSLSEKPYIDLAKVSGLGTVEILFKEILPNTLPYVGAGFAQSALMAMISETGIRFLGVGPPGIVTLGYVINYMLMGVGSGFLTTKPYLLIPPIMFLALIFISLSLVNVGLDEAYNPRLRKTTGL
jgi:peptide/nickel transport system permease protein